MALTPIGALMRSILAVSFITACGPAKPGHDRAASDTNCPDVFYADSDGDGHGSALVTTTACAAPSGFTTTSDDCDDEDTAVHPGASELCNALDDDCDGSIDIGALDEPVWYVDADSDGYGDDALATTRCTMPAGCTSVAGDCDDGDSAAHPDAAEMCDGIDDDCDALVDDLDSDLLDGSIWYADADNDGYGDATTGAVACTQPDAAVDNDDDCDDGSDAVHPAIDEVCDGIDNDCDGLTDDADDGVVGRELFYADSDGDGLGAAATEMDACSCPKGYVANDDDCDDSALEVGSAQHYYDDTDGDGYGDGAAHEACTPDANDVLLDGDCAPRNPNIGPGAVEVCDHEDNDCDWWEDEEDPDLSARTYYGDSDGDGFGSDSDTIAACSATAPYVVRHGDCDDTDDVIFPDAREFCDSKDNDCDGTVDDSPVYVHSFADDDGDGYGDRSDWVPDCAIEGYVFDSSDCDDTSASVSPGAPDVCANDVDDDCDDYVDNCVTGLAGPVMRGDRSSLLGTSLAVADWNADAVPDLLVGAPDEDASGAAYVALGPDFGTMLTLDGPWTFGYAVAGGDGNGDGVDDLLVGARYSNEAYLFLGPVTSDRTEIDAYAVYADAREAGYAVDLAADVDGDGHGDVLVGAPWASESGKGAAYVIAGALSGAVSLDADATYALYGSDDYGHFGESVAEVGDVDGDGIHDLAIGAPYDNYAGRAYVVLGGMPPGSYEIWDRGVMEAYASHYYSYNFGARVLGADYNGDGLSDLFVGALAGRPSATGVVSGAVYAYLGPLSGPATLSPDVIWNSETDKLEVGAAIAVEDVDGDGDEDVVMGAPCRGCSGDNSGRVYIEFGKPSGGVVEVTSLVSFRGNAADAAGSSVAVIPDWDGDGALDVAVGAPDAVDAIGDATGAVYLIDPDGGP
jgi:hypothetical protein